MKPSEKCKEAGLNSLAELIELSKVPEQTLIRWEKEKPVLFEIVILGAVQIKLKKHLSKM